MSQRLYVGNLSFQSNQVTLRAAFAEAGEVSDVRIITDRESGQSRGFAFVTMATPDGAKNAIATLNGALVDGRPIRVNEAEERGAPPSSMGGRAPMRSGGDRGVVELPEGEVGNPRPGGHRGW